jgi:hypothetical protein
MANYYRITAYHKEKDISIIMDSYGLFEKKWQFSAFLVKHGFEIMEVSSDEQFIDINIDKLIDEKPDKIILRACAQGLPKYCPKNVNGITHKIVSVGERFYIPNN